MCIDIERLQQLASFQEKIEIHFKDPTILNQAFKHPSLTNEKKSPSGITRD